MSTAARIAYTTVVGTGIAVRGSDIDTDRIIPARFMKCVTFEGLGQYAFYDSRYDEQGQPKNHPFNDPRFDAHPILIVNRNFGCGSSREHAPQALQKWGIRAVIGESFAEIFAGNCTVMGIPTLTLPENEITQLQTMVETQPETVITIDLVNGTVIADKQVFQFGMQAAYRNSLIQGTWDSTGVLLENIAKIKKTGQSLPYVVGF